MTDVETPSDEALLRIAIADDHAVVRDGLHMLLDDEAGFEVVAEAEDVGAAKRVVRGHRPDVLVLDLNMPGEPSLPAIPEIAALAPGMSIVVLTMQDEPAFAREALAHGASGYVLKHAAGTELVEAIRTATGGGTYLNPALGARMATERDGDGPPGGLSLREAEVLKLIALGYTNNEIAEQLYLSVRTIETHRAHIQGKLRLTSRAELVRYALDHGLLTASPT
ncbi:MAG TPA: response regulator transcription factor [Thermoleophilaceae bacterium]|nr:response regulator transcription factor [Thermoleophilaceae bacterium]